MSKIKKILKNIPGIRLIVKPIKKLINSLNLSEANPSLPDSVRIEASALCQLNCVSCPMRTDEKMRKDLQGRGNKRRGKGWLAFSDFKNFVDRHPFIKTIELSNFGEMFLNPEIVSIIEYAFLKKVKLTATNGVNLNTVSDEMLEALVKYEFDSMLVSIDGASQEVYGAYRRNGDYDKVIGNIRKLNEYKQKYDSIYPKLMWSYVLMEHNEQEVIKAKEEAKKLNMDISFKITWDRDYIPKEREMLQKETGNTHLTRSEIEESDPSVIYAYLYCHQLWSDPQINWDGRLLGCCCAEGDFGVNVFKKGLLKALGARNLRYAKLMVQGKVKGRGRKARSTPCFGCARYKKMIEVNRYFAP